MEPLYQYAWLIPVLPLIGAALVGSGLISYNQATNRLRQGNAVVIISLLGAAMVMSLSLLWSQLQGHAPVTQTLEWAAAGDFHLSMGVIIDPPNQRHVGHRYHCGPIGDDLHRWLHGP